MGGYVTDGAYTGLSSDIIAKPYRPQREKATKKKTRNSPFKKISTT